MKIFISVLLVGFLQAGCSDEDACQRMCGSTGVLLRSRGECFCNSPFSGEVLKKQNEYSPSVFCDECSKSCRLTGMERCIPDPNRRECWCNKPVAPVSPELVRDR